jgi:hypothetical protein
MKYWFKECPKCHGDLREESNTFGEYITCMQCGYMLKHTEEVLLKTPSSTVRDTASARGRGGSGRGQGSLGASSTRMHRAADEAIKCTCRHGNASSNDGGSGLRHCEDGMNSERNKASDRNPSRQPAVEVTLPYVFGPIRLSLIDCQCRSLAIGRRKERRR